MSNQEIGGRLRAARKAGGYKTALSFCEKFNLTRSTYAQHEAGGRIPKDKQLTLYAEKLGVSLEWLKTGKGDPLVGTKNNKAEIKKNLQQNGLAEDIINKRFAITSIDEMLLADLLEEVIDRCKERDFNSHQIAKAVSALYNSLQNSGYANDPEIRLQLVKVAINMYFELLSKQP